MTLVAICQIEIELGRVALNLEKVREYVYQTSDEGAEIIVFPELTLTGYALDDDVDVDELALRKDTDQLTALSSLCARQGSCAVIGFIEAEGDRIYNSAAVFGIDNTPRPYRKVHLPNMGIDRLAHRGNLGFPVFQTDLGTIGLNICYDQRFPESARSLAVQGAQVIIVPTSEIAADHDMIDALTRVRAYENRVYYLWANRTGEEAGALYNGCSRIVDPFGEVQALAGSLEESVIYCDIDPELAVDKQAFENRSHPEFPSDLFGDRSPESYCL